MATHHILCVHGIGVHEEDWLTRKEDKEPHSFESLLKETWNKYPSLKSLGEFSDEIKLHSIRYDDEINRIFDHWAEQAAELKSLLGSSPLQKQVEWFTKAVDSAGEAKKEAGWRYTHLMDLLMFLGSPTLQKRLVTFVANQIIEMINKRKKGDRFSLIAHSMGCAMAHKALQALYHEGVDTPRGRESLPGNFAFVNVTMVANTSYSLSRDKKTHYQGRVKPSATAGVGCCTTWITVNHRLDPVGRFMPFDHDKDPDWLDPFVASMNWCRDLQLTRFSSADIHSLTHYFRDPLLHLPYFELTVNAAFKEKEKGDAIKEFAERTPDGDFKGLISHLSSGALDVANAEEDYAKFFSALKAFFVLTKK